MPSWIKRYKDKEKYAEQIRIRRNKERDIYYKKSALYSGKKRFTEEDCKMILNSDLTDSELSILIEHSVRSIQMKRTRLKREMEEH